MSPCSDDALKLDYINGTLSEREATAFETHLATCPLCRQEIGELRKTAALIASLTLASPPVAWTHAAKARLSTRRPVAGVTRAVQRPPTGKWTNVLQYAGIAVGTIAGLALLIRLVVAGTVAGWLPGLPAASTGISEPEAARTVALVAWCLALHVLILVPPIIDNIYLLAQAGRRRRYRLHQGLSRTP